MYFKIDFTIRGIYLDKDIVEINYGGAHKINVTLRIPTEEEQAIGHEKRNPFCIVVSEWAPKDHFLAAFKSLADNKMPKGSKKTDEWSRYNIDLDGNIKYKTNVPSKFLPDVFVAFLEQVKQELNDYAKRTVNLLRWRCGTEGEHDPFASRGGLWSFDGQNWQPMPERSRSNRAFLSKHISLLSSVLKQRNYQRRRTLQSQLRRQNSKMPKKSQLVVKCRYRLLFRSLQQPMRNSPSPMQDDAGDSSLKLTTSTSILTHERLTTMIDQFK